MSLQDLMNRFEYDADDIQMAQIFIETGPDKMGWVMTSDGTQTIKCYMDLIHALVQHCASSKDPDKNPVHITKLRKYLHQIVDEGVNSVSFLGDDINKNRLEAN